MAWSGESFRRRWNSSTASANRPCASSVSPSWNRDSAWSGVVANTSAGAASVGTEYLGGSCAACASGSAAASPSLATSEMSSLLRNARFTRFMTPFQLPGSVWRNSRMRGYQGLSSRRSASASRRRSAAAPRPERRGRLREAATAVSTVISRSRFCRAAPVSWNADKRLLKSTIGSRLPASSCSVPFPFCKLYSCTPGTSASGANDANGTDADNH